MSKIAIIGAGHLGIVYAAGLAELGHIVRVVDIDAGRVRRLKAGHLWFHEPGLPELMAQGMRHKRISFTTDPARVLRDVEFVFVCVPTPPAADGSLDETMLRAAFDAIGRHAGDPPPVVINKSTAPVGWGDLADRSFGDSGPRVVSSPEFLAEGRAIEDFFHPHRIVLGSRDADAARRVEHLFAQLQVPVVHTDNTTAEFTKLGANAFLAMKISFANALARLSEEVGADTEAVALALSLDPRIGRGHLQAGVGFGGSCLPKDVAAMEKLARGHGANPDLFAAVLRVNRDQRKRVLDHLKRRLGTLGGKRIAVLGLAFKAGTDDTRESVGLLIAEEILAARAEVAVYDPLARPTIVSGTLKARFARSGLAAMRGADATIVATEWPEFANLDLPTMAKVMRGKILIDGRGIFSPIAARAAGLVYYGFGRGGKG